MKDVIFKNFLTEKLPAIRYCVLTNYSLFDFLTAEEGVLRIYDKTKCFDYKGGYYTAYINGRVMMYSDPIHTKLFWLKVPKTIHKTLITRSQLSNYI